MSNHYVSKLGLNHDPFTPGAPGKEFFGGGGRQELLDELLDQACHAGGLHLVTAEPGSGKSILAATLAKDIGRDARVVRIQATLFMAAGPFLQQIIGDLKLESAGSDSDASLDAICVLANDLALDARNLVLIVDDAHELASDVINLLAKLLRRNSGGGLAVILLGEKALDGLLENSLPEAIKQSANTYTLDAFSSEDSLEYVRFKLAAAGYRKPLPLSGGELGGLHNAAAGNPGRLHGKLIEALNRATADPEPGTVTPVTSLLRLGQSYWLVALGLAAVMLALLLLQDDAGPELAEESSRQQIPVAVNSGQSESTANDVGQTVALQPANAEEESNAPAVQAAEQSPAIPAPDTAIADSRNEPPAPFRSDEKPDEKLATLTAFERQLLGYAPGSFTVQIMAASSAASIERFLDAEPALSAAGYYESRLRGEPWFVVVSGNYQERTSAQAAISDLPTAVRELQPWVRSLADIQASIRDLH